MKITIVTVCLNSENTIERCILSVAKQTYPNIEYIIIDGASTDKTPDIINKYRSQISTMICEPDNGIYDAMNKALRIANGDFLIFIGADDYLIDSEVISNVVRQIDDTDSVYYGDVFYKSLNNRQFGKVSKLTAGAIAISHQALFYPRTAYQKFTYNTKYKIAADWAYNINLFANGITFHYLDMVISYFSEGGFSSQSKDEAFNKDRIKLVRVLGLPAVIFCITYPKFVIVRHNLHILKERLIHLL